MAADINADAKPDKQQSGIILSDGFVKSVLSPALVILFIVLALPVTFIGYVFTETQILKNPESGLTLTILAGFSWFQGLPKDIGGPVLQILPAIVAAICLSQDKVKLTIPGRVVFLITLYIIVLSIAALLFIAPDSAQADNITGGKPMLTTFLATATFSLNTMLVYFGLLTGLMIKVKK